MLGKHHHQPPPALSWGGTATAQWSRPLRTLAVGVLGPSGRDVLDPGSGAMPTTQLFATTEPPSGPCPPGTRATVLPGPDPGSEPEPTIVIPDPNPNPDPAPIIPDPNPNPDPAPVIPDPSPDPGHEAPPDTEPAPVAGGA